MNVSGLGESSGLKIQKLYPGNSPNPNTKSFRIVKNKKLRHPDL